MGQNSSMGQFTGVSLKLLPPKKIFSITLTILIGQWPNLLTFRGGDHASATPLESDKMATRAKKAKTKSRYRNKFKTEWSAEFPSIVNKIDTKFRPSLGNTTVCALLVSKINSGVPCPKLNVSEQLLRDVKLLQIDATMTCELREKKQLPTAMLQSSRKM